MTTSPGGPPLFDDAFRQGFDALVAWRRDVRRFRPDPVDPEILRDCLALAQASPSVGNSQPWRFVRVGSPERRAAIVESFEACNGRAVDGYEDERARAYGRLKLEGLREAPIHLAVFCDEEGRAGHGLGRETMPETLRYSVVLAVHTFWLAARSRGLGVGWVSILDPDAVAASLDVAVTWRLVAYLCVGHAAEEHLDPELVRHHWQDRLPAKATIFDR